MRIVSKSSLTLLLAVTILSLTSCLTSKKMDKHVSYMFNNQLPRLDKKKKADIIINSSFPVAATPISNTIQRTSKVLPLVVYWQYDYRHTTSLNPGIAVSYFTNAVHSATNKTVVEKLNGQRLELTVEKVPTDFALVDKGHIIWLIYAISWHKIYMEPDFNDLVVSYRVFQGDKQEKEGKITIKSVDKNKGIRYFQTWKSATSEYLMDYNANMTAMSKAFMNKLMEEL